MGLVVFIIAVLVCRPCYSRSIAEEESVVSVYTTQPTTVDLGLDVYHQIANNIAERITSPIFRFLGINSTKPDVETTKKPERIELLDEVPEEVTKSVQVVDNDILEHRDVEELSVEALKKIDKKPEKITLYTSFLPFSSKSEKNELPKEISNVDDDDDDVEFSESDIGLRRRANGPFVYILEWIASMVQLAQGALESIFKPNNTTNEN